MTQSDQSKTSISNTKIYSSSMTALGSAYFEIAQQGYQIEIKSVNSKGLELKIHLPESLSAFELPIRNLLKSLNRGKVDLRIISAKAKESNSDTDLSLDLAMVKTYLKFAENIRREIKVDQEDYLGDLELSVSQLLQMPGVLKTQQNLEIYVSDTDADADQSEKPNLQKIIIEACQTALKAHIKMRKTEGEYLGQVLLKHLEKIEYHQSIIIQRIPYFQAELKKKTIERLENLVSEIYQITQDQQLPSLEIDQARLALELGLLIEKTDIIEEMDRLKSHISQMKSLIQSPNENGIGRKCDFLCQELLREVNTTGSKANDIEIIDQVIELKVEIERLREQVQNIE
jgi:uncharacterized protein (TIGR00255 family)